MFGLRTYFRQRHFEVIGAYVYAFKDICFPYNEYDRRLSYLRRHKLVADTDANPSDFNTQKAKAIIKLLRGQETRYHDYCLDLLTEAINRSEKEISEQESRSGEPLSASARHDILHGHIEDIIYESAYHQKRPESAPRLRPGLTFDHS